MRLPSIVPPLKSARPSRSARIGIVVMFALFILGLLGWTLWDWRRPISGRGGLPFPGERVLPKVPHFRQADPRWGRDPLAAGPGTLATEGCAVAAAAMVLGGYGVDVDPGRLNRYLKGSAGFTKRGWLKWEVAEGYAPGTVRFVYEDLPSYRLIDLNLLRGNPAIVRVRMPNRVTHFLVVVGKRGLDYLVLDPASTRGPNPLREFGSPVEALRLYRKTGASSSSTRPFK